MKGKIKESDKTKDEWKKLNESPATEQIVKQLNLTKEEFFTPEINQFLNQAVSERFQQLGVKEEKLADGEVQYTVPALSAPIELPTGILPESLVPEETPTPPPSAPSPPPIPPKNQEDTPKSPKSPAKPTKKPEAQTIKVPANDTGALLKAIEQFNLTGLKKSNTQENELAKSATKASEDNSLAGILARQLAMRRSRFDDTMEMPTAQEERDDSEWDDEEPKAKRD